MTKSKAKKKRDKTPEARAETQFYAIYYPWPPHPNLELEGFQKQVAFWLAGIMGSEALICIYHKPKCFSYIIIEVLQTFKDWDRALLGQHLWSEVFKDPVYANGSSYVYYSKFDTDRQCQKRGWKRVDVQAEWYANWSYNNRVVVSPYPRSRYCQIPKVETTYGEICHYLPIAKFPEASTINPAVPPPIDDTVPDVEIPVPGSSSWQQHQSNPPAVPPPPIRTARSRSQQPSDGPSGANGGADRVQEWVRNGPPPQSTGWVFQGDSNEPTHFAPPGLSRRSPASPTSTDDSAESSIWTGSPEPSDVGTPRPGSPATSDGGDIGNTPAHTHYQPSEYSETPEGNYEEMFSGINLNGTGYAESVVSEDRVDDWDRHETDGWSNQGHPSAEAVSEENLWGPQPASSSAVDGENLWDGYGKPTPKAPPPEDLCLVHGKICSRGICKQYAAQKRAIERKKATEKAFEELREKSNGKKKKSAHATPFGTPPVQSSAASSTSESDPQKLHFFQGKPSHLASSPAEAPSATRPATGSSTLPARGRKMNANSTSPPITSGSAPPRPAPPSNDGWGYVSRGPWGGPSIGVPSVKNGGAEPAAFAPRAWGNQSAAPSMGRAPSATGDGWGHIGRGPWGSSIGTPSAREDDAQSVASSHASAAWGRPNPSPSVISRASSVASAANGTTGASPTNQAPPSGNGGSVPKGRKARDKVKKSWAEQVEDEDDTGSISETVSSGWG